MSYLLKRQSQRSDSAWQVKPADWLVQTSSKGLSNGTSLRFVLAGFAILTTIDLRLALLALQRGVPLSGEFERVWKGHTSHQQVGLSLLSEGDMLLSSIAAFAAYHRAPAAIQRTGLRGRTRASPCPNQLADGSAIGAPAL